MATEPQDFSPPRSTGARPGHRASYAALLALACGAVLLAPSVHAACTASAPQTWLVAAPATLSIPRDEPLGTLLWTSAFVGTSASFTCDGTGPTGVTNQVGTTPAVGISRMPIGTSGISWVFQHNGNTTGPYNAYGTGSSSGATNSSPYAVSLVVTGPIQTGTVLPAGVYGYYSAQGTAVVSMGLANAVTLASSACTTANVTVDMGQHRTSEFKGGVGAVSSAVAFAITLNNCPAGLGMLGNPAISYQIDTTSSYLDANHTVVALTSGSSAQGIGVQILNGSGTPLPMGVSYPFSGYTGAPSYSIPFQARYYQTGSTINPGTANASLTFTMTYQ